MRKIGDKVVCKSIITNINGIIRTEDPNITIGKTYLVIDVSHQVSNKYGLTELVMLDIIGKNGKCSYWSDYFYSVKELRQLKLKKINNTNDNKE